MGAVCCCLHVEDFEDYVHTSVPIPRHCICLRCFVHRLLNAYTVFFRRGEVNGTSSSIQGATPLASGVTDTDPLDNSLSNTYRSPPRPLPYDADPRCSRLQRDGLVSRRDKSLGQFHEESEPLRRNNSGHGIESITDKWNGSGYEGQSKICHSESSVKIQSGKMISGIYALSSTEDEDVCPTCLEEYTLENPKITTQCSHCFHLGCIYEWMERSESCPVCGKLMEFNESL